MDYGVISCNVCEYWIFICQFAPKATVANELTSYRNIDKYALSLQK